MRTISFDTNCIILCMLIRSLRSCIPSHRRPFAHAFLHTSVPSLRRSSHRRPFAQAFLRTGVLSLRRSFAQASLRSGIPSLRRSFEQASLCSGILSHRRPLAHALFSHRCPFTYRRHFTQSSLRKARHPFA